MKRVTQPQMPTIDIDGYGMQQVCTESSGEHDNDDSPHSKKKTEPPRRCFSYIIMVFLFFSALYGMATLTGGPIEHNAAAAAARSKFQSFAVPGPLTNVASNDNVPVPVPVHVVGKKVISPPVVQESHKEAVVVEPPIASLESLEDLHKKVKNQEDIVRKMKQKGIVMEEDKNALIEIAKLQDLCRQYIPKKYGKGPHYLQFDVIFPATMADFDTAGADGSFLVQLGPIMHVPYSVFFVSLSCFIEQFCVVCILFLYIHLIINCCAILHLYCELL
jgi:hypothetical protein